MCNERLLELESSINRENTNIGGIAIFKDYEIVYEKYFNMCNQNTYFHISSITKSIISMLIGICIDKGYINDINQKVLEFFPDYKLKRAEKTIKNITIKNLITMTAPYKYKSNPYTKVFSNDDWVKVSLDLLGGKGEIGEFRYVPIIGLDILSGIISNTTNKSVLEFAQSNLFNELGIIVKHNIILNTKQDHMDFHKTNSISGWVSDPKGINTSGWGLTLNLIDMLNIGRLYLNNGIWNDKQLVSSKWVDESTKFQSMCTKLNYKYGYLWWIIHEKYKKFAAIGDSGNIIYVNCKDNIVIAISSLFNPKVKDRLDFIKNKLEPIFL